jgi:conjugal transfer/entry exclusion protein
MKLTRTAMLATGVTVTAVMLPAFSIVGGGLPVFDGSAFAEMLVQTSKFITQINQMVQTYQRITQQYNHMVYQAKYITNLYRYNAPTTVWRGLSGADTYGRTGKWIAAINSGLDTVGGVGGWQKSTTRIATYPGGLASVPASQRERRQTEFAAIELQDGTAASAMDTIGRVRLNGPRVDTVLALLEGDSLSSNPDMHTEAAQLNKANAIALIQTKALADQQKLLVASAEIGLIRMKQEREAAAYALANDVAFRTDGKNAMEEQHSGASTAIMNFRLP